MAFGDTDAPTVRVCCGPRCGVWPRHRAIYDAAERAAASGGADDLAVAPTMCQGRCGDGVTVVLPSGDKEKARDADEARAIVRGALTQKRAQ